MNRLSVDRPAAARSADKTAIRQRRRAGVLKAPLEGRDDCNDAANFGQIGLIELRADGRKQRDALDYLVDPGDDKIAVPQPDDVYPDESIVRPVGECREESAARLRAIAVSKLCRDVGVGVGRPVLPGHNDVAIGKPGDVHIPRLRAQYAEPAFAR